MHCQAIPSGPRGGEDSPTTKTTLRINTESTHDETIQSIVNSFRCAIKDLNQADQITDISPVIATAHPHHKLLNSRNSMLPNPVLDKLSYSKAIWNTPCWPQEAIGECSALDLDTVDTFDYYRMIKFTVDKLDDDPGQAVKRMLYIDADNPKKRKLDGLDSKRRS